MADYGAFGRRVMYAPLTEIPDYGLGPMTQATQAGLPNAEMTPADPTMSEQALDALLTYGPMPAKLAVEVAKQPYYAGEAVGEAAFDPTLPNLTNAGFQSALALAQPMKGLGILGAGYGLAGARDAGLGLFDEAHAKPKGKAKSPETSVPELPGLSREQQTEYVDVVRRIERGAFTSGAERRSLENARDRLAGISAAYQTTVMANEAKLKADAAAKDREEYDRAVSNAEMARDKELSRVRRFSETEVGKMFDKTGGWAPFAVAAGLGGLSRAASGPAKGWMGHAANVAQGAFAGAMTPNVSLAYNAFFTEPDNPERAAYLAYSRELPIGHPLKEERRKYAESLPTANPVRTEAAKELYDPMKAAERMTLGAVEGIGGWYAGKHAWDVPSRLSRKAGEAFRGGPKGPTDPPKPPTPPKPRVPKIARERYVNQLLDQMEGGANRTPRKPAEMSAEAAQKLRDKVGQAWGSVASSNPGMKPSEVRSTIGALRSSGALKFGVSGVPASAVLADMLSRMEDEAGEQ